MPTITRRVERRNRPADDPPARATLEAVYRDHFDYVWRLLVAFGVDESAREDAAHDVFIVVHNKLPDYDGSSAITTWLFGIVRRVAANARRRASRTRERRYARPASPP